MKTGLLLVVVALALLGGVLTPSAVLAAKPTEFTALVIPTNIALLEDVVLGKSDRHQAEEVIAGFIMYPTWDLLANATVQMSAHVNYSEDSQGVREGVMRGKLIITKWAIGYYQGEVQGTLELKYNARVKGNGGCSFAGQWTAVEGTGVFKKIKARGTFFANLEPGPNFIPPTLAGSYH